MFQMGFQQAFLPSRLQRNVSSFYFQHVCLPVRVGCMLNGNTFQLESAACASETSVLLVALFQVNLCFLKNQPLSTLQTRRVYQDTSKHRQVSPLSLSPPLPPSLSTSKQPISPLTYSFLFDISFQTIRVAKASILQLCTHLFHQVSFSISNQSISPSIPPYSIFLFGPLRVLEDLMHTREEFDQAHEAARAPAKLAPKVKSKKFEKSPVNGWHYRDRPRLF